MSEKKKAPGVQARVIKSRRQQPVVKAETATQLSEQAATSFSEWLDPPVAMRGCKSMVEHSSILPQCIKAYKNNVAVVRAACQSCKSKRRYQ